MRQIVVALLSITVLGLLAAPAANAGVTCQIIPQMCPPAPTAPGGPSPVPEPGTLALLAAGVGAAGMALRRRRNKP